MTTPLKYLYVKNEKGKGLVIRRGAVSVLAASACVLVLTDISALNIFGGGGLIDRVGDFVSTLTGFYVAALVAVATFGQGKPEMDEPMLSGKLYVWERGRKCELSRREYLTALFGYLVTLAFLLSLASILVAVASGALPVISASFEFRGYDLSLHGFVSFLCAVLYFSTLFHLVAETSIGLNYLVDKLYRSRPTVTPGSLSPQPNDQD